MIGNEILDYQSHIRVATDLKQEKARFKTRNADRYVTLSPNLIGSTKPISGSGNPQSTLSTINRSNLINQKQPEGSDSMNNTHTHVMSNELFSHDGKKETHKSSDLNAKGTMNNTTLHHEASEHLSSPDNYKPLEASKHFRSGRNFPHH